MAMSNATIRAGANHCGEMGTPPSTLGVLGGVPISPQWLAPALMVALLIAILIGDHPRLFASYRVQTVTLDQAILDEAALLRRLETLLGGKVRSVAIRRVDM